MIAIDQISAPLANNIREQLRIPCEILAHNRKVVEAYSSGQQVLLELNFAIPVEYIFKLPSNFWQDSEDKVFQGG